MSIPQVLLGNSTTYPGLAYHSNYRPENCRWLFGQEVNIITFHHPKTISYSCPQKDYCRQHGSCNTICGDTWYAVIVPKACSLKSLVQRDINDGILFKVKGVSYRTCGWTCEGIVKKLQVAIADKIGEILQVDSGELFQIDKSAIPAECNIIDIPAPTEPEGPPTVSDSIQATPTLISSLEENPEIERDKKQTEPVGARIGGIPEGNKDKLGKQAAWRWATGPSGRLYWEEYELDISDTKDISDSDRLTTTPRPESRGLDQQMVRDEVKLAMRNLLKCLIEHIEGIS